MSNVRYFGMMLLIGVAIIGDTWKGYAIAALLIAALCADGICIAIKETK